MRGIFCLVTERNFQIGLWEEFSTCSIRGIFVLVTERNVHLGFWEECSTWFLRGMNFEVITENNFWLGSLRGIVSVNSWVFFCPLQARGWKFRSVTKLKIPCSNHLKIPLRDQVKNSLQRTSQKFLTKTKSKIPLRDQVENSPQWPSRNPPQNSSWRPTWKFISVTKLKLLEFGFSQLFPAPGLPGLDLPAPGIPGTPGKFA